MGTWNQGFHSKNQKAAVLKCVLQFLVKIINSILNWTEAGNGSLALVLGLALSVSCWQWCPLPCAVVLSSRLTDVAGVVWGLCACAGLCPAWQARCHLLVLSRSSMVAPELLLLGCAQLWGQMAGCFSAGRA